MNFSESVAIQICFDDKSSNPKWDNVLINDATTALDVINSGKELFRLTCNCILFDLSTGTIFLIKR